MSKTHSSPSSSEPPIEPAPGAGKRNDERQDEFLNARQAAALLGVKLPTVYAYTSRGLLQSVPGGRGRARR